MDGLDLTSCTQNFSISLLEYAFTPINLTNLERGFSMHYIADIVKTQLHTMYTMLGILYKRLQAYKLVLVFTSG